MADKETDDILEDASSDTASKGISKPLLIKIAIGLLALLILTVAAYFFFMPSDKPSPEDAAMDINAETMSPTEQIPPTPISESAGTDDEASNAETPPLSKEQTAVDTQLLKIREQAIALKEENRQMKERLQQLEAQQNSNIETPKAVVDTTSPEDGTKVSEAVPQSKKTTNPYTNLYSKDETAQREPKREPPPEPKWGDFDPLYRGK